MRTFIVICLVSALSGCAGTMLDGRLCMMDTSDELTRSNLKDHIIDSYVDDKDKAKAKLYLSTAKLGYTALCEMARAREAVH